MPSRFAPSTALGFCLLLAACSQGESAGVDRGRCGDGELQAGEACDDGPDNSDTTPDACRSTCAAPACGDGVLDAREGCDEGEANGAPGSTCGAGCVPVGCGDGHLDAVEECDDGDGNSDRRPDACRTNCRAARCGDGVRDTGEACDEGVENGDAPGACRATCVEASCGDGVVDPGEGCDAGAANSDVAPDACRTACEPATCGDGVIDTGEGCDDGAGNGREPDACRLDCRPARCGDGIRDTGEACDAGAGNSDRLADTCRTSCALPACGDDVVDSNELCDDGTANDDGVPGACRTSCEPAACGDGVVDPEEGCDDGNLRSLDGCDAACTREPGVCGDGTIEGAEQCDDGNLAGGDGCDPRCVVEVEPACDHGTLQVVDLRVEGTPDDTNGYTYSGTTEFSPPTLFTTSCGAGTGGAAVAHVFPARVSGTLVAELAVPPGDDYRAMLGFSASCAQASHLVLTTCTLGDGMPGAPRRLIVPNVQAGTAVYVVVSGGRAEAGAYSLHVRILPPLPAGGVCRTDGSAGPCGSGPGLGCADPDGDGAGTCVPVSGPGGPCDPAGVASLCAAGQWCGPAGACVPACGNGRLDAGERCDDGNAVDGDNCSNTCVEAGRTCAWPFDLNRVWDAGSRSARITAPDFPARAFRGSCSTADYYDDLVASFTAPEAGTYAFHVTPTANTSVAVSLRADCGVATSELACAAPQAGRSALATASLAAGQAVVVLAESRILAPADVVVERVECGDGRRAAPEECDDGNTAAGDNCSPTCVSAGSECLVPWNLAPAAPTWSGSFRNAPSLAGPSCNPPVGATRFARFVAPAAGTWNFTATGVASISAVPACGGAEAGCTAWPASVPLRLQLGSGAEVVLQLTGATARDGAFLLEARRTVCGDGTRDPGEECDDGNLGPGDGCDAACGTEWLESEPNDLWSQADAAAVGRVHRGSMTGYDQDVWLFQAVAGTRYVAETFVGTPGACGLASTTTAPLTRVRVRDGTGRIVADDLDSGVGLCSRATFVATTTGPIWVRVQYYEDMFSNPLVYSPYFLDLRVAP